MNPNQYADHYFKVVEKYIDDILNDKIICGKLEKKSVEIFLNKKEKYQFKPEQVRKVFKFFSLLNINHKNKVSQFRLLEYQAFIIWNVYGLYVDDHTRLIDTVIFSSSKKNGKSSLAAALSLFECIADGELDANILFASISTDQARLVLNYTKLIIENSPAISKYFKIHRNQIINKQKGSFNFIEIKSSLADSVQGKNSSLGVVDEIFYHENENLLHNIKSGMANRKNPLLLVIGTVSTKEHPNFNVYESAINILNGVLDIDSTMVYIFQQDHPDEVNQPETWRKSTPAIDYTVQTNWLIKEFALAEFSDTKKQVFLRDHLNFFLESTDQKHFIDDDTVKSIMSKEDYHIPTGSSVYVGSDFSSLNDLSSVAYLHYDKDQNLFRAKIYHIFPNNEKNKIKKGSIDLSKWWLDDGQFENDYDNNKYIIRCNTKSLDENIVIDLITDINNRYRISAFGYDPFNALMMVNRLESELFLTPEPVRQNYTMSFPLKFIEKLIEENRLIIDQSPVTRWQFKNLRIKADRNNNYLITKNKGESVDGIVALTVAMTVFLKHNQDTFGNMLDYLVNDQQAK